MTSDNTEKPSRTAKANAARRRKADEKKAAILTSHGWLCLPPWQDWAAAEPLTPKP